MCLHMYGAHAHGYVCMWEIEETSGVISGAIWVVFWDNVSPWLGARSTALASWLMVQAFIPSLCLRSSGTTRAHHYLAFSPWVLDWNTGLQVCKASSCLSQFLCMYILYDDHTPPHIPLHVLFGFAPPVSPFCPHTVSLFLSGCIQKHDFISSYKV